MYSKLEKVPDNLVMEYFELLTELPLNDLPENPRERQKLLAWDVARQYHGEQAATEAQKTAIAFTKGSGTQTEAIPEFSLAEVNFPAKLFYILNASNLCASSSEARRQIKGGAVRLDGEKIADENVTFDSPAELSDKVLQVGKKKFVRLVDGGTS
jgi:tyrosyl-tRNA synthetase